jgi:recombination protein RecT
MTATVRSAAVAKRDEAPSLATIVRQTIDKQAVAFRQVLPANVDPDRFGRLVLTAVKANPQLMECFATDQGQVSVLLAAMQAAAVGLEPNTPTQDAWLLPRRNKGVMEAQLSIGYRGYLKLARRSGDVKAVAAECVYTGDEFHYERGLEGDVLRHIPSGNDDPADITHAYAICRYKDGGYSFIVLTRRQIEARRAQSDSWRNDNRRQYSPWTTSFEAMCRKSAIRALVPYLPLTADVERVIAGDEQTLHIDDDAGVIAATYDEQPAELAAVPDDTATDNPGEAGQ